MNAEMGMAQRKRTAYLGDVGEVKVLLELLDLGAAVHLITGSDYGWDLHVQVPLIPTNASDLGDADGWSMSGRAAHVQVKKKSSSKSPSVDPGTIRGWISGSEVGVPTFAFIVLPEANFYLSPRDLKTIVANWESGNVKKKREGKAEVKSVTLSLSKAREYNSEEFSWLLHLWTKYPGIMYRSSIEDWAKLDRDGLYQEAYQFTCEVVLAWMKSHFADIYLGPGAQGVLRLRDGSARDVRDGPIDFLEATQGADALGIAQAAFLTMYPDKSDVSPEIQELSWGVLQDLEKAIHTLGFRWPKSKFMTTYASSPDIGKSREEAMQLVRDVMGYYNKCLAWREQLASTKQDRAED